MSQNDAFAALPASGFDERPIQSDGATVDELIYRSWVQYLTETLGRERDFAHQRAMADVQRTAARTVVERLRRSGWSLAGQRILDVGSGHSALAIELALAGAEVTAVEPSSAWREVAHRRTCEAGVPVRHVDAVGEQLPFADGSFDGVISKQVLEHVQLPDRCLAEMARVLRDGGKFHITCENYLAFREQHYGVRWWPALPRRLGALYLRARGRNPEFLLRHVTYTYWPSLLASCVRNGLIADDWLQWFDETQSGWSTKQMAAYSAFLRVANDEQARTWLATLAGRRRWFRVGFQADGTKGRHAARRSCDFPLASEASRGAACECQDR